MYLLFPLRISKTIEIVETDPFNRETPLDPFLSERLLITKSPLKTNFLLSPWSVLAALASCGTMPSFVTESASKSLSLTLVLLSRNTWPNFGVLQ